MKEGSLTKYINAVDLHNDNARQQAIIACLIILGLLSLVARISLIKFNNGDYIAFSSWYDFLKNHGLHGFKYAFSDYNPPITYFLYVLTLLPIKKMVAIKGLMLLFDIVLALCVYLIVKLFRPTGYTAYVAALATMFLPTVLITGVMWGQFDQLYTAFILLSLYYGLRNNSKWAWLCFGVAMSIKLQAIFFLPVLGVMIFKRIRWIDCFWAILSFAVLTFPPLLAGRAFSSLYTIYSSEARIFKGYLTINTPNFYQWFSNNLYPYLYHAGIVLAVALSVFLLLASLIKKRFSAKDLLLLTTLVLYLVPFFLPAMHERYFFPAGVASLVLAFVYPTTLFIVCAVAMQVITLLSYGPFLIGVTLVPFYIQAFFVLAIIFVLTLSYLRPYEEKVVDKLN